MAGKSRQSANLVSDKNIFVDVTTDNTGIGTTSPKTKLDILGDVAVSGILTVGISSSVTIDGNSGIISATTFYGDGSGLANIGLTGIDDIEDVNLSANNAPSDGRALIYQNGEWIAGPVIGGVNYILETPELYWDNVSLLLHLNGSNGSTNFIDTSNNQHSMISSGSVQLDTSQYKYGTSSAIFNGGTSDYLQTPSNSVFNFGTGDFTIEMWFRVSFHSSSTRVIFAIDSNNWAYIGGDNSLRFYKGGIAIDGSLSIPVNTWHHIAYSRSNNIGRLFLNGVLDGNTITDNTNYTSSSLRFGGSPGSPTYPFTGWIDEIRVTKGVSRYTDNANFTPPTSEFPDAEIIESFYTINNLDDVDTSTTPPSNGQSLVWNSATQLWRPSSSSIYSQTSGFSTNSSSASYAQTSGFSTFSGYATISGFSTISSGLTTTASVNTTGIITASQFAGVFLGDGSGLTNIVATGSGVEVRDNGNLVGVARTLDFGDNLNVEFSSGIITVSAPPSSYFVKTSAGIHTLDKVGIGTTNPVSSLDIFGNVNVAGTSGQLFSVTDNLSTGSIFSVNDISGIPSIDVDADGTIELAPYNGNVGVGTTRPRAKFDVIGNIISDNISAGIITATTFSGNIVTRVNGVTGIVSIGIVNMTDFLYQPQGVVTLTDRWDLYNAINSSGGWDISSFNSLTTIRLNWVPSFSQNGTTGSTWRTNFLNKVKAGDLVQWSKDGINWNSAIQPFDSYGPGSNSVGFYAGTSVPTGGSMYVRYITTKATGNQPLQNGQILQFDSVYSRWMPFGPFANWESTSAGINTLRSVGIGTTNPQQEFHVYNSLANSTPQANADIRLQGSGGTGDWLDLFHGSSGAGMWNYGNRPLLFATDATPRISVSGIGNVGIGTTNPLQTVQIGLNDYNVVAIDSLGDLGIGTITPTSKLDVRGDVIISGIITASSFIGNLTGTATTATALTSDASVNTSGVVTATKFVGDGSGLTGIVATSGGGVFIQNDNVNIGAASTINFTSNFIVESAAGIATIGINTASTITAAAFVGDGSGLTNVSGGGGGASSRTVVSGITTEIPVNGIGNTEIAGFKTYGIMKVGLSTAAWIRLYTDSVSRDNDVNRPISNDPTPGSGLVAEIATAGLSTVKITPFVVGFNDDDPVTNTIYISIRNLSGIATNVLFDLTILKLEE